MSLFGEVVCHGCGDAWDFSPECKTARDGCNNGTTTWGALYNAFSARMKQFAQDRGDLT
jgi:hypothetical protein